MKVVYVAGPFRAINPDGTPDMMRVQDNIMRAMWLSLEVWKRGHAAICPHANTMFFTGAAGCADSVWLDGDLELIRRCDAILMTPDWRKSSGACTEHSLAQQLNLPILYTVADLAAFLGTTGE